MMDTRDFVQLTLLAMGGEIQGKTKLQKTVYFLGVLTGCVDDLGYRPHFYGPYSDDVADALGWLRTIGAVDTQSVGAGLVDQSGFEVRRFDYRLNDEGRRFTAATASRFPDLWVKVKDKADRLKRIGLPDYLELSIAAKTYFMLQETNGHASEGELARLASRFGWQVSSDQLKEAAAYLQRLELVQISTT